MQHEKDYQMTWLGIIVFVFIFFLVYLVFAPFYLEIDSENNLVRIRFHHLASARLLIRNSSLTIQLRIMAWNKEIDLPVDGKRRTRPTLEKREAKWSGIPFRKIIALLKSFKINTCYVNIDCGDMQWNGILFPLLFWMSRLTGKDLKINFIGENTVKLQIENNFARIIWAFLT